MTRRRPLLLVAPVLALVLVACGGEDATDTTTTSTTTTAGGDSHGDDGEHRMGVEIGTVDEVEALGPGPAAGETWELPVGLAVCGRYVDAPTGGSSGGVSATGSGTATVGPSDDGAPTVGDYASAVGISLSTGELVLPEGVAPAEIEVSGEEIPLGGTTLRTGDRCGRDRGEVQVWVYSEEAVRTGEGILTVVTDPQDVPFVQEGMAVVVAFAPESSLPTLPPSALGRD